MRLAMTMLLLSLQLWAAHGGNPKLFAQMGDPLYDYAQKAQALKDDPALGRDTALFAARAETVRHEGLAAEKEQDSAAKAAYLKQLRGLQEEHNRLMVKVKSEMLASIKTEDAARFTRLVSTEPPVIERDDWLYERAAVFYKAEGLRGRSPFMDRLVRQRSEKIDTIYSEGSASASEGERFSQSNDTVSPHARNTVIVLGTPTCPYCIKARKFLRARGIPFRDLNIHTSREGKQLFRKHNGRGVPLILIGESRISGFNPDAILRAYGR
jgi:glutaredoxin